MLLKLPEQGTSPYGQTGDLSPNSERAFFPVQSMKGLPGAQLSLETWALVGAWPKWVLRGTRTKVRQNWISNRA